MPISVPPGAQGVLVSSRSSYSDLTVSSSFTDGGWQKVTPSVGASTGLSYAAVTSVGEQTITPSFGATLTEGPVFLVTFVSGIDNSSFGTWVRDAENGETTTLEVDAVAGDLVVCMDNWFTGFSGTPGPPPNQAGWTSHETQEYNNIAGRVRSITASGSTVTANAQTGSGGDYSGLTLVSLIPASVPPVATLDISTALAIRLSQAAAASADVVVSAPRSESAAVTAAIRGIRGYVAEAALAVQSVANAALALSVALAEMRSAGTSARAAVATSTRIVTAVDVLVYGGRRTQIGASLYVFDPNANTSYDNALVVTGRPRVWTVVGSHRNWRTE